MAAEIPFPSTASFVQRVKLDCMEADVYLHDRAIETVLMSVSRALRETGKALEVTRDEQAEPVLQAADWLEASTR